MGSKEIIINSDSFNVIEEYIDERENYFKAYLKQNGCKYSLEIYFNNNILFNVKLENGNTEGCVLNLPKDEPDEDKRVICLNYWKNLWCLSGKISNNVDIKSKLKPDAFLFYQYDVAKLFTYCCNILKKEFLPELINDEEQPEYIKKAIKKGLLFRDGLRVVKSLESVAEYLRDESDIDITEKFLLENFRKKNGDSFSSSAAKRALNMANTSPIEE